MERERGGKECLYRNSLFSVWKEEIGFIVKDDSINQSVWLTNLSMQWVAEEFKKMLNDPVFFFFSSKKRLDAGFVRLTKFKSSEGWFAELAVWPHTGGKRRLHIPVGRGTLGWQSFADLIRKSCRSIMNIQQKEVQLHKQNSKQSYHIWVKKEKEMLDLNLNACWVVTRLMEYNSWALIKETLEDFFQTTVALNPFFEDKALLKLERDPDMELTDKWVDFGPLHLKLEKWSKKIHSRPEVISSYGGWIVVRNLPLEFWKNSVFEAIGFHLGGLKEIDQATLNGLDCEKARIRIEDNICGFIPASLTIEDTLLGKFEVWFERVDSLSKGWKVANSKEHFSWQDFTNSVDRRRIQAAMEEEENFEGEILQYPEGEKIQNPTDITQGEAEDLLAPKSKDIITSVNEKVRENGGKKSNDGTAIQKRENSNMVVSRDKAKLIPSPRVNKSQTFEPTFLEVKLQSTKWEKPTKRSIAQAEISSLQTQEEALFERTDTISNLESPPRSPNQNSFRKFKETPSFLVNHQSDPDSLEAKCIRGLLSEKANIQSQRHQSLEIFQKEKIIATEKEEASFMQGTFTQRKEKLNAILEDDDSVISLSSEGSDEVETEEIQENLEEDIEKMFKTQSRLDKFSFIPPSMVPSKFSSLLAASNINLQEIGPPKETAEE